MPILSVEPEEILPLPQCLSPWQLKPDQELPLPWYCLPGISSFNPLFSKGSLQRERELSQQPPLYKGLQGTLYIPLRDLSTMIRNDRYKRDGGSSLINPTHQLNSAYFLSQKSPRL